MADDIPPNGADEGESVPSLAMPPIGFGIFQSANPYESITAALQAGFRHIDGARVYKNEAAMGQAVIDAGTGKNGFTVPRDEIFVTSKINARSHSLRETPKVIRQSLSRSQLAYIDLYLLHDAVSGPVRRLEAWSCLLDAKKKGLVRMVGVSNWNVKHLEELKEKGWEMPRVNQIELHPWCQQKVIVEYCRKEGIVLQAYCPLVRGERMQDPALLSIASRLERTPAQVLLRWSIQSGFAPIVKSDTPSRIQENYDVFDFEIGAENMERLNMLDMGKAGACSWNPVDCA